MILSEIGEAGILELQMWDKMYTTVINGYSLRDKQFP